MAITRAELEALIERDGGPEGRFLSVYLDCDQSRQVNLNREFITALTQELRALQQTIPDEDGRARFQANAERVVSAAKRHEPRGRSLVFFSDTASDFFFERELAVPLRTEARWERRAYVRPLIELLDEHERYAVVLADKQEAHLFTVYLGEIEEDRDFFSEHRKRFKQTGRDSLISQPRFQRRDDEHAQKHLRGVAEILDRLASQKEFDRLVLGGSVEALTGLRAELSERLRELVTGEIGLPVHANEKQVLEATSEVHEQMERRGEVAAVDRLITAAAKRSQAVLGLPDTLEQMRLGRILRVVYAQGYAQRGSECSNCGSLFPAEVESCAFCGGQMRPPGDIVTRLVDRVVDSGGEAESVRGEAAERLKPHGSVGAFLRF